MGAIYEITSASWTFFSTLTDIASDLANSMEFIGYNISEINMDAISKASIALIGSGKDVKEGFEEYNRPITWGRIGILIIFLPGIITLPPFLALSVKKNKFWITFVFSFCLLLYPFTFIFVSFASLVQALRSKDAFLSTTQAMVGAEVFFEGFWQMVLQVFSLVYGYQITSVQKFSIGASFIFLAKASMEYDLLMIKKELTFKDSLIHAIKILPCYATTIIFRVIAFGLTISFLRGWSVIPIIILYIELVLISCWRYRKVRNKYHFFEAVYMLSWCNLAVLNTYNLGEQDFSENDKPDEKSGITFIRLSSIVTFVHHSIVLFAILGLTKYNPQYLQQDQFENLKQTHDGIHFSYIFGFTIVTGLFSTILSLHLASKIMRVEVGRMTL